MPVFSCWKKTTTHSSSAIAKCEYAEAAVTTTAATQQQLCSNLNSSWCDNIHAQYLVKACYGQGVAGDVAALPLHLQLDVPHTTRSHKRRQWLSTASPATEHVQLSEEQDTSHQAQ